MRRKRVLFIVQLPPPVHGASTMNSIVFERISQNSNYNCKLIELNFARDLSDLQVFRLGKIVKAIAIYLRICWSLIAFRPYTVYFSMVPLGFVLLRDSIYLITIKLLRWNVRPILHFHKSGLYQFSKRHNLSWLYRLIFRRCTIIHLSPQLIERELVPLKLRNVKIYSVPNSIQHGKYQLAASTSRDRYKILFLSNLLPQKGYKLLVEAVATLKNEFPEISLTIAGQAPGKQIEADLRAYIASHGIVNAITLTGVVSGIRKQQLFEESSIFVLPSKMEYFPLVLLEAMSYKVAVITSGRENLGKTFTDKEQLLFLDEINPRDIAHKIRILLSNEAYLNTVSENGYKRWLELQQESGMLIDKIFAEN